MKDTGPAGVALTFDDGPVPGTTDRILEMLERAAVVATFFVCGAAARRHPGLLRQIVHGGHAVGNHTWSHRPLTTLSDDDISSEFRRTNDLIESTTGVRPTIFRPPYGRIDERVRRGARGCGLSPVLWSIDPEDWHAPECAIIDRVLSRLRPGATVLLHDGCGHALGIPDDVAAGQRAATVAALPRILSAMEARDLFSRRASEWTSC